MAREVNFDGLIGPTHNYGGLGLGNVASQRNAGAVSNPRQAARQGLAKMHRLMQLGLTQGVLPPQERPAIAALRQLGFSGTDEQVLTRAAACNRPLLAACSSASSMWAANACTVSPSADTADARVHFTVANLTSQFHRSLEAQDAAEILQRIFASPQHFAHHTALPSSAQFADEGAANHTRFCQSYAEPGIELFVYGRGAGVGVSDARQTREASQAIVRLHGLRDEAVVLAQQNPEVIAQGVFHNDVIAVGNANVLFYHQQAFANSQQVIDALQEKLGRLGCSLSTIQVPACEVSVEMAVRSYLFNSQLVCVDEGRQLLIAPHECQEQPQVWEYLQHLTHSGGPIAEVQTVDLKQSMRNGGGPACLRLRVVLTDEQLAAVNPGALLTPERYTRLLQWVDQHYRDRLTESDLADPQLLIECRTALDELTQILNLGSLYAFQRG